MSAKMKYITVYDPATLPKCLTDGIEIRQVGLAEYRGEEIKEPSKWMLLFGIFFIILGAIIAGVF